MRNDLLEKGYTRVMKTANGEAWVKIRQSGSWMTGRCVLVSQGLALTFGAAVCMKLTAMETLATAADKVVSGELNVGGFGKSFKKRIHRAAVKIAKMKVLNKLRGAYIKALKSPIADLGIAAGARALSAFGVPAAATRVALTQRRNAQADRLADGGWAGMLATATEKDGAKKLAKQILERNKRAAIDALPAALPGGGAMASLGKLAGNISTGYDPETQRAIYNWGANA